MTNIEIGMMVAFILAVGLSGWKLYAFMPNKPLVDDDTNQDSTQTLKQIMYESISEGVLEEESLVEQMKNHPLFEKEHFWRFNLNRLRQLLASHYIEHPEHQSIHHIHQHLKDQNKGSDTF